MITKEELEYFIYSMTVTIENDWQLDKAARYEVQHLNKLGAVTISKAVQDSNLRGLLQRIHSPFKTTMYRAVAQRLAIGYDMDISGMGNEVTEETLDKIVGQLNGTAKKDLIDPLNIFKEVSETLEVEKLRAKLIDLYQNNTITKDTYRKAILALGYNGSIDKIHAMIDEELKSKKEELEMSYEKIIEKREDLVFGLELSKLTKGQLMDAIRDAKARAATFEDLADDSVYAASQIAEINKGITQCIKVLDKK